MDESYVREILAAARKRKPMTPGEFALFTQTDVNGGYAAESDEAARRYFAKSEVYFGWDPAAPGSEKTTCRCRCGCLHVWQDKAADKCSSCGARFIWNDRQ